MERLTERDEFGNADIIGVDSEDLQLNLDFEQMNKVTDSLNKLAEYEDLEGLIGIPLKDLAEIFRQNIPEDCKHPHKAVVLTDDDVDRWEKYKDFATVFRKKMTETVCEFLSDKEEFCKWLDRNIWIAKKCDEYARAEEQGLLLRLPCKVGSTVYAICTCEAVGTVLDGTLHGSNGGFGTATGYYCPYELSDKCPHIDADDCDECKNIESVFEDTIDYINITEYEILIGLKNTNLCVTIDEIGKTVFLTQSEAEAKLEELRGNQNGKV